MVEASSEIRRVYDEQGTLVQEWAYEGEMPHGPASFYHEGGLTARLLYQKGTLEGEGVVYHPHQKPRVTMEYHQGKLHGTMTCFNEQGQRIYQCGYQHGQKQGLEEVWHEETQVLIMRTSFEHGLKEGEECWFYEHGGAQYRAFYKKGHLLEGPFFYDSQGHIMKGV